MTPANVPEAGQTGHRSRKMACGADVREFVGSKAHDFACQVLGWPIRRYNLLVEGETDAAYLNLAIELVRNLHGLDLSEQGQLSIFPPGCRPRRWWLPARRRREPGSEDGSSGVQCEIQRGSHPVNTP